MENSLQELQRQLQTETKDATTNNQYRISASPHGFTEVINVESIEEFLTDLTSDGFNIDGLETRVATLASSSFKSLISSNNNSTVTKNKNKKGKSSIIDQSLSSKKFRQFYILNIKIETKKLSTSHQNLHESASNCYNHQRKCCQTPPVRTNIYW